ncbi:MAG TPA: DinB family protein [Gemmatimonadaceae bacterium]|nr:DinB family protein [Gemmatimonadaceae bacterium]
MPDLPRLFAYDAWANREAHASLARMSAPPVQGVRWLAHVAAAQLLWWERIHGMPQSRPVWPELSLDETAALLEAMGERWTAFLTDADESELAREAAYVNSRGEAFHSRVDDILLHVVLHGVHHRGQIATGVRAAGGEPAYTDFIHAVRTGRVE